MSKQFWAILAAIVIIFIGVGIWQSSGKKAGNYGEPTSHIKGDKTSSVKLVEYGDYQCPGCGAFYQTVKQVNQKYDDRIAFQFVNFPLTSIHPNTFAASRAAEAAGLQGKYWQMHDILYEQNQAYYQQKQPTWIPASDPMKFFVQYAQQIGLNVDKFKQDFKSAKVNNWINADKQKGEDKGVDSTPTFFLNGKKLDTNKLVDDQGQPSVEAFSQFIDEALKNQPQQPQPKAEKPAAKS